MDAYCNKASRDNIRMVIQNTWIIFFSYIYRGEKSTRNVVCQSTLQHVQKGSKRSAENPQAVKTRGRNETIHIVVTKKIAENRWKKSTDFFYPPLSYRRYYIICEQRAVWCRTFETI